MKKLIYLLLIVSFYSCGKEENIVPQNPPQDTTTVQPPVTKNGVAFFYLKRLSPQSYLGNGFKLWINGEYFGSCGSVPNFEPYCGSFWGLNYSNVDGVYNYHAEINTQNGGSFEYEWNGSFTLSQDGCVVTVLAR